MWREIEWSDFCEWVKKKTWTDTSPSGDGVVLTFKDGSRARVESQVSGPYSEVTPDVDISPPTVEVWEAK